jgi:hypothetical protein
MNHQRGSRSGLLFESQTIIAAWKLQLKVMMKMIFDQQIRSQKGMVRSDDREESG